MDREQELLLIQDIQSGQTDGFAKLYDHYFQPLYNHIYYKTTNQELTEDVVSDSFFKAFDKISSFRIDTESSFRSRLYTIANNVLLDSYKKKSSDWLDESIDYEDTSQNLTKEENTRYISEQIMTQLDTLGEKKKSLIIMRVWDGLSYEEIAGITGRTPVALRKEFSHTMGQLREVCGDLFVLIILYLTLVP
jgi:RNA polymerase sigma-70 factor, ECF subfamily